MKIDVARAFAQALLEACDKAEHEGSDTLPADALDAFEGDAEEAIQSLEATLKRMKG